MTYQATKAGVNPDWGQTPYTRVDTARYISPEHVKLEREHVWPHTWQAACREEEIPKAGDYFEYEVDDQSLIIVRTKSGQIKAYFNSCLHRGTQLVKGCGNVGQFACPFHGWRWSLDGENRYVHDRADFPGLTEEELRLPQAQVGSWAGFVFVKLTQGGDTLEEFLGPVPQHLADYRMEDYRIRSWRTAIANCNWKVAVEAFEETYHTMGTHPQFLRGIDDVGTIYETIGIHSRMLVPTAVASGRFQDVPEQEILESAVNAMIDFGLSDDQERAYLEDLKTKPLEPGVTTREMFQTMSHGRYGAFMPEIPVDHYMLDYHYTIFPNIVFNLYPGSLVGIIARPNGADPDTCVIDIISLQHPAGEEKESTPREYVDNASYDWGLVMSQDLGNFGLVQQGMHSTSHKQLRLASYQEKRIDNRFKAMDEYIAGQRR